MFSKINIRATILKEFWGNEYERNIYLWEGGKHNLTLGEIERLEAETLQDIFTSGDEIDEAIEACKRLYFRFIPILAGKLNKYHSLNLSDEFWQIAFGYWLYRHICIVYEKYHYLSKININESSIKLLDKRSFFIPFDYGDHVTFFASDLGVQQLVSEYYYLFADKKFETVEKNITNDKTQKVVKNGLKLRIRTVVVNSVSDIVKHFVEPKVILLNAYYAKRHLKSIFYKSRGKVFPKELPKIELNNDHLDVSKRKTILFSESNDKFENYLTDTLIYCTPSIFIEHFKVHYSTYLDDVMTAKYLHIVSEGWIGQSNAALYCAIANEKNKNLIFQEHASGHSIVDRSNFWIYSNLPQMFLTTGWTSKEEKIHKGGFVSKLPQKYSFKKNSKDILFIGHSSYPYLVEFSWHPSNSSFLRELYVIQRFVDILPKALYSNFKFRPRRAKHLWDTELTLGLADKKELVDRGNFSESIHNSRIVVIDHISTGIAELLQIGTPFLLLMNDHVKICSDAKSIFKELEECGLVHYSPDTVVEKLIEIYDKVEEWWKSKDIAETVEKFRSSFIASPSTTIDFLLKLSKNVPIH